LNIIEVRRFVAIMSNRRNTTVSIVGPFDLVTFFLTLRRGIKRCAGPSNRRKAPFVPSQSKRRYLIVAES
jgi:hypothetical protein